MDWSLLIELSKEMGPSGAVLVVFGAFGLRELSRMRKSVEKLNIGMAVIIERLGGHEKRIRTLERKK